MRELIVLFNPPSVMKTNLLLIIFLLLPAMTFAMQGMATDSLCAESLMQTNSSNKNRLSVRHLAYQIVGRYPHDPFAFTQGLLFYQNKLYESTGLLGKTEVRQINLNNGKIEYKSKVSEIYFGEGLTDFEDQLIQMSWKTGKVFFFDPDTLSLKKKTSWNGNAWGVTTLDSQIIISDGSANLYFVDPENFKIKRTLVVTQAGKKIQGLNELEYAEGAVFANVWPTPCIVKINPDNGDVLGWLNLSELYSNQTNRSSHAVLNGIAYQRQSRHFFITGKLWPFLYEIKVLTNENNPLAL